MAREQLELGGSRDQRRMLRVLGSVRPGERARGLCLGHVSNDVQDVFFFFLWILFGFMLFGLDSRLRAKMLSTKSSLMMIHDGSCEFGWRSLGGMLGMQQKILAPVGQVWNCRRSFLTCPH